MTANIKPLLLNSLPDSFLLSGIFRKRRLQQSLLPPYRNPLLKSSLLSSLRNFLNDDISLHIQGSYGSLIYHSHHHLIHTRRCEKRILPVKFQKPVYYQFSFKNLKEKKARNGPFQRVFLGILPVKLRYYQLSFKTTGAQTHVNWSRRDSNSPHSDCEPDSLPDEIRPQL